MQCRDEDLKFFYDKKIPLFRVHKYDGMLCTCGKPECQWVKSPDGTTKGSAGKHPAEDHGFKDARPCTDSHRFDGYNVGVVCGRGIAVVDVDPRNGGLESLAALVAKHGDLPRTPTASTGDGTHYYYAVVEQGIGKRVPGIDFIGVGGYVLAPSSLHPSQKMYEWLVDPEDCELAPMPQWIIDECCYKPRVELNRPEASGHTESDIYTSEDAADAIAFLDPNKDRDYWMRIGMALKDGGFPFEVWDDWAQKSPKHPGHDEALKQWNSYKLGGGIGIGTFFFMAEKAGWSLKQTTPDPIKRREVPEVVDEPEYYEEEPAIAGSSLRETAQGIIGELACWMYDTSVREYDAFAVAGALAILSTCAQGSYTSWDGRSLSLYQICLLPAAGGKDHYLSSVEDTLHDVDARLVMSMPGSSHGLRGDMFAFNSRILCMDEVQDFFAKMSGTDNVFVSQVMSDIKELYNGKARWKGSSLKTQVMPDVYEPRMTWVGFGTPGKFKQTINSNMVGGGLLSRILLWDVEQVPKRSRITRRSEFSKESIGALRRLANKGVESEFKATGMPGVLTSLGLYHGGKTCIHVAQTRATHQVTITREASRVFAEYDEIQEARYMANPDSPEGAIYDRASTQVAKIASLHALGCRRVVVDVGDVEWAIAVANATIEPMARMARTWMADSPGERLRQRLLAALSATPRTRHLLMRSLRMSSKDFDLAAQDLVETYQVKCPAVQKSGKFPPDATFSLAKPAKKV